MTIRMFSYKIVRDYGFAPNPFHGYCTLATCKPQIRKHAKTGDLILGYGSKGMGHNEELIYIMQVDEKITYQQYWDDVRFYKKNLTFTVIKLTLLEIIYITKMNLITGYR